MDDCHSNNELIDPHTEIKVTGGVPRLRIAGEGLSPAAPPPASGCGHGIPPEGSPPCRHLGKRLLRRGGIRPRARRLSAASPSAEALGKAGKPPASSWFRLVPQTSAFRRDLGIEPKTVGVEFRCSTLELVW